MNEARQLRRVHWPDGTTWTGAPVQAPLASPRATEQRPFVFISYARDEGPYARELATFLSASGITTWFDERITAGANWARVLEERVEGCVAMIVVISSGAPRSEWMQNEYLSALEARKPIFPLRLSAMRLFPLMHLQHEDVFDRRMPSDAFTQRVLTSVSTAARPS